MDYDLDSIKDIIQEILDKHQPEENKFSVQELDEDSITILIQLLLERDIVKRETLWKEIESEYQKVSEDLKNTYNKILEIHDQVEITPQLGNSLEELKANIKNDKSLSQLEKEIWF